MRAVLVARTPVPVSVAKVIPNIIIYILSADGAATVCYGEPIRTILQICSDQNPWRFLVGRGEEEDCL